MKRDPKVVIWNRNDPGKLFHSFIAPLQKKIEMTRIRFIHWGVAHMYEIAWEFFSKIICNETKRRKRKVTESPLAMNETVFKINEISRQRDGKKN